MDWLSRLHGTDGLMAAWAITAVPLWIGMAQRRAPLKSWLLSPIRVVVVMLIAAVVADLVRWLLSHVGIPDSGTPASIASLICFVLIGYAGGRFTRRDALHPEMHKRGAFVADPNASRGGQVDAHALTLAGVVVPSEDETKHFKLIGTTGTGKSTAIRELLGPALARGDRAVIADPDGGYLARFYDAARGDVILNPFDERSGRWDLFGEIRNPYDVEHLAGSLIPAGEEGGGREWRGYARTFLTALVRRAALDRRDLGQLWHQLTIASSEELRPIVAGTPAQPFLEPDNARMFGSVRSVAGSALAALEYIQGQRSAPLSVREWVKGGRGVLFIPYQAEQIAALRTMIAAWMRLAIFEAMREGEGDRRLWFIVDELDALGPIEGLKDALARLRKFGGRCVLGFQSIAQVSSTYGAGEAQTIVENCGNTLILRCSGSEGGGTSRFASRLIGEREVIRRQISEGHSHGGFLARDGARYSTNISEQHVTETAVMASELEQLPDLVGLLKLASYPAWMRVSLVPTA